MDPNRIDLAGLPTTFAIIGVVTVIVFALRYFNQKFPQVAEQIKAATPWMGWCEEVKPDYTVRHRNATRPNNRW